MSTESNPEPFSQFKFLSWLVFNLVVLAAYLGFFYLCLVVDWPFTTLIGIAMASLIVGLYVRCHRLFLNRYEVLFYSAVPLDILIEGFSPFHTDYSFYGCAISFWTLFVGYRACLMVRRRRIAEVDARPI